MYPVISVDAKKKENVGEFKNPGRNWTKKGQAKDVNVYDFPSLGNGKATPYGIYDINRNEGMVNVGMSYDTSEFAVESIRQWWLMFGRINYPNAKKLMICAMVIFQIKVGHFSIPLFYQIMFNHI